MKQANVIKFNQKVLKVPFLILDTETSTHYKCNKKYCKCQINTRFKQLIFSEIFWGGHKSFLCGH